MCTWYDKYETVWAYTCSTPGQISWHQLDGDHSPDWFLSPSSPDHHHLHTLSFSLLIPEIWSEIKFCKILNVWKYENYLSTPNRICYNFPTWTLHSLPPAGCLQRQKNQSWSWSDPQWSVTLSPLLTITARGLMPSNSTSCLLCSPLLWTKQGSKRITLHKIITLLSIFYQFLMLSNISLQKSQEHCHCQS